MHLPFIYSLLIILLVYGLKKIGLFQSSDYVILSRVVMNFTFPAVILKNISTTALSADLVLLPIVPILMALIASGLGFFVFRTFPADRRGLMMLSTMGVNIGLFAFPIIEGLFGAEGLRIAAVMDIGNTLTIFGFSYLMGAHYSPLHADSRRGVLSFIRIFLKSPPFMAYILALFLNVNGLEIPGIVTGWVDIFAGANQFLVLLVLGLVLNFDWKDHGAKGVFSLLLLRYFVAFLFALLTWYILPFDHITRKVAIICMILPVGFLVVPYSHLFGYDEKTAGGIINMSLVLGFFTMWALMVIL